jgi:hypothetical protein
MKQAARFCRVLCTISAPTNHRLFDFEAQIKKLSQWFW